MPNESPPKKRARLLTGRRGHCETNERYSNRQRLQDDALARRLNRAASVSELVRGVLAIMLAQGAAERRL